MVVKGEVVAGVPMVVKGAKMVARGGQIRSSDGVGMGAGAEDRAIFRRRMMKI